MNKIKRILLIPSLLIITCSILSCTSQKNNSFNKEEEAQKITQTINNVFGWAVNKNIDLFLNSISSDSIFRSITPYNRVVYYPEGIKQNKKFWLDPRFKAISHEIKDLKIEFSQSKNYAWFYCTVSDYNEWDGNPANWENARWTGVLEKRNNDWKVVQQHFSFSNNK